VSADTEEHVVGTEIGTCGQCGIETFYISANFQVPLHPGECTEQMWVDYHAALNRHEQGPW
jgi:hypothetical protein